MFLRKFILLSFIIIINFSFAQKKKKKTDTVYVYENVIVYDTVYLEKPLKIKLTEFSLKNSEIQQKELKDIMEQEINKEKNEEKARKKLAQRFEFGIEAGMGIKNSNWTINTSNNKKQTGENLGIWISKKILLPQLSLLFSANVYRWNSTFDLDGNIEDTYLNGFYFTKDNHPVLFQRFNNKHFEYTLQLKLLYEWKNIRPFAGFLVNRNNYKMQFLVPENNVLNKLDDFKTTQINFGFSLGVQYKIWNNFLISVDYQQFQLKNISLKNSTFDFDIFKTNNTFAERKVNLGIAYIISK